MQETDITRFVLADRKRRRKELIEEMRTLSRHKRRIRARHVEGLDWPLDAGTGDRADIDPDDVRAPLPDDMKAPIGDIDEKMALLRKEADGLESFAGDVIAIDDGVLSRRRRERSEERAAHNRVHGHTWTVDIVEARIEEAYRTLFRSAGGRVGPREFGNAMPEPVRQMSDLISQAGNKSLRRAMERMRNNQGPPSTDEVRRMDDALSWTVTYLREEHVDLAMFVNMGGMWKAWGAKITKKCQEHGFHRQVFYRDRRKAIETIVAGLIKSGKAPT